MKEESAHRYCISRLDKSHEKNAFDCGVVALNDYLKTHASQDAKKHVGTTYVLTAHPSHQVLGFYTLSSMRIFPGELPESTIKKLLRYPNLPGILIGRLAVDRQFQNKKLGAMLLVDALKKSLWVANQIGVVAVIVDAKDAAAVSFYRAFGFIELPQNRHRLFLSMSTLKELDW